MSLEDPPLDSTLPSISVRIDLVFPVPLRPMCKTFEVIENHFVCTDSDYLKIGWYRQEVRVVSFIRSNKETEIRRGQR